MRLSFFSNDAVTLGTVVNSPFGLKTVKLNQKQQALHANIWGRSGKGKSRFMQSLFLQHFRKQHGVGILEPHHDLSFDTLKSIVASGYFQKDEAFHNLIYLDFGNKHFIPFNVLKEGANDPYTVSDNVLQAMGRVWPEVNQYPRFKEYLLCSLLVLIANQLPVTYLRDVLTNPEFRRVCLKKVDDPVVLQVFSEYEALSKRGDLSKEQLEVTEAVRLRMFQLTIWPVLRYTLGQPDNWLNFRDIMDRGQAVIINLGNVDQKEAQKLLGAFILVQLEQAAMSRKDVLPSKRRPFTVLVDEWPSFAAQDETIATILSQARKFNLRLYLAGQSMSQVSTDRLSGALENCGLTVVFGVGSESAKIQAENIGEADPFTVKEEQLTETQHNQFMPIYEQYQQWKSELEGLPTQIAYVKLTDQKAVKIRSLPVPDAEPSQEQLNEVLARYRQLYQRTEQEAKDAIASIPNPLLPSQSITEVPIAASGQEVEQLTGKLEDTAEQKLAIRQFLDKMRK